MLTMDSTFKIAVIQHACSENLDENLSSAEQAVREAARDGAEIICLQELFGSRYFCSEEDTKHFSLAEEIGGQTLKAMQELAASLGVVLVVPFFEKRAPGVYHNSAGVVDSDGSLLGIYRKMHIPDDPLFYEKFYFTPGDVTDELPAMSDKVSVRDGFAVFDTSVARISVLICWDQWYPEAARLAALAGAEVLFFPTAIGWHPSEKQAFGETLWRPIQTQLEQNLCVLSAIMGLIQQCETLPLANGT